MACPSPTRRWPPSASSHTTFMATGTTRFIRLHSAAAVNHLFPDDPLVSERPHQDVRCLSLTLYASTEKGSSDMATKTTIAYEKSSGNVFADVSLPHPERELRKVR